MWRRSFHLLAQPCYKLGLGSPELRTVLEDRFDITDEETRKIFAALDASNHEEVKYSEFLAAMMSSRIEIHEDLVRTAFKRFDTDNSGFITVENLRQILGETLESEDQAALILAEVPQFVHDAQLSYDEFIEYLISGEAEEHVKAAASMVIDKQISLLSNDKPAPLEHKGYVRAKSFSHGLGRVVSDSSEDTATAPVVERHRTAPAPTAATAREPAIEEVTESEKLPQRESQPARAGNGKGVQSSVCNIL